MKLSEYLQPLVAVEFVHRRDAWVVGVRRRTQPVANVDFFRGSQWIALNRRGAVEALTVDPDLTAWFKRSWIPDESYFHTVLRHAGLSASDTPTTFVLDTPEQPTTGWMRLTLDDLPAVWEAATPFARKVDPSTRPEVAQSIDGVVDRRRLEEQDSGAS